MTDSADGTVTGLKPGIIQLDSVLTVRCSTGQADDIILTFAGELDAVSVDRACRYVRDAIDTCGGPVMLDVVDVFLARCGSSSPCCDARTVPRGDTDRTLRR